MVLATTSSVNSYIGTGGANAYPFNFNVFVQTHIVVTINAPSPSTTVYTLNLGTDFTVSGLNTAGGPAANGTVTLVNSSQAWLTGGNLTTGYVLNIQRVVPLSQTASIRNQGDYYPGFIENELDYLTMAIQQLQYSISLISGTVPAGSFPNFISIINVTASPTGITNGATHLVSTASIAIQLNLPRPTINTWFVVKDSAANASLKNITLHRFASEQIDGSAADFVINTNGGEYLFVSDGTNWFSIAGGYPITALQLSYLPNLYRYRRPVLTYVDSTHVDVELGIVTGGASDGTIVFPDGQLRTESTQGLRRLNIAQVAALSGAKQSGLRTGAVVNNTWYACYAVKSGDTATDWVLVADTVQPTLANYATLNSNFGANSWAYLGMIRYGDQNATPNAILSFVQIGNRTLFTNTNALATTIGVNLATTAGAAALTYTGNLGTTGAVVPVNCPVLIYATFHAAGSTVSDCVDTGSTHTYYSVIGTVIVYQRVEAPVSDGLRIRNGSAVAMDINLAGFVDVALGVGTNPLL